MCGIAGVLGSEEGALRRMLMAMTHRGPDDSGVLVAPGIAMGMTRLAILDTSHAGHQPMSNEDGSVTIVYNGETFNFRDERRRLEQAGFKFRSASDTEVVLRLYEECGPNFLHRIRGMFALAIYDRRKGAGKERLLLARDPLGIKPLLYSQTPSGLVFASEVKGLLAGGLVRPRIDAESLRLLLTFGSVPQPRTIIENVYMLPAGHLLTAEGGSARVERYWSLGTGRVAGLAGAPYQEQVECVRREVEESLRLQLVSDVPLGAFLSAGVDSSILVALMARHARGRVCTFSVGFRGKGDRLDETAGAERTAKALGTEHTAVYVTGEDVRDHLEHFARSLDQPSVDGLNTYFVSKAARRAVTVAISGTGGDELFAGYEWFAQMAAHSRIRRGRLSSALSRAARHPVFDRLVAGGSARIRRWRAAAGFLPHYARLHGVFGPAQAGRLLAGDCRARAAVGREPSSDIALQDELSGSSVISRVTGLCLRGYTQNQLLRDIDAVSMAHSLEVRVPLLDRRLVDVALSLPDSAKLLRGAGTTYAESGAKRILIDAFREVLAPETENTPKRGFAMPYDEWLRTSLRGAMEDLLSEESVKRRGLFSVREVKEVLRRFDEGQVPWTHPWLLMITELWCRQVIDPVRDRSGSATS